MDAFPPDSPLNSPATPQHLAQIVAARVLGVKIRRVISVAKFSGWTIAIFAAITALSGLASPPAFLLGAGMGVIAYFELRGAGEIKRLDRSAPKRLAINQLAFMIMLILYAAYELVANLRTPMDLSEIGNADPQMLQTIREMAKPITIAIYVTIMIAAILGPGLTAVYYYTRTKYIDRYLQETPPWILDLQRAGMSV